MTEIYETWSPIHGKPLPSSFNFKAMNLHANNLTIDFSLPLTENFSLDFAPMPLLLNVCNESFRLGSLPLLPKPRQGSMYLVKNSKLLERFHGDSLGIYLNDSIVHLAIVTDEWIDLLLSDLPVVRWK